MNIPAQTLYRSARVLRVENGMLSLLFPRRCANCVGSGCHGGRDNTVNVMPSRSMSAVAVGDRVQVGLPRSHLTRACAWVFGLPLFGLIAGAVIAAQTWVEMGLGLNTQAGALMGWALAVAVVVLGRRTIANTVELEVSSSLKT